MRRFSQKNQLVTLNEINITPLLDLAFVLLIIFVITRPMLEQSMTLKVPGVGKLPTSAQVTRKDIRAIEIDAQGNTRFRSRPIQTAALLQTLLTEFRQNPKIVVTVRADRQASWQHVAEIQAFCMKNGIIVSSQVAEQ